MNKQMLGMIDTAFNQQSLQDLTACRSIGAVPFAGRYRLIDFILSSMVNSGIRSVAVFSKPPYRSLMDHLGSGKEWDLHRKKDGLFFLPSSLPHDDKAGLGSFPMFFEHLDYLERSSQQFAVITNSYTVCQIPFEHVLKRHLESGCDLTEICQEGKPLDMYVIAKKRLKELIEGHRETGLNSFAEAVNKERESLSVSRYEHSGYTAVIDTPDNYLLHSLKLIDPACWRQVFHMDRPVFTKMKNEPPVKYSKTGSVKQSIIADGCVIEGEVENSILFRGVYVGKGTKIKNSIIMQKTQIGEGCRLENVICDKDVKIGQRIEMSGTLDLPFVLKKGAVQGALMNS
ncbi:sugar phosphate nucleotidyltransferase [Bacillus sp. z60-18]|uniref:sugar phosphate nucleotidyltransferase n=1 Tax=Bacillus TaxID=1386 RepID=UPI00098A0DD2|nr:sugar phosphate nucleotidyltransferase [Bacillus sonorensis]